MEQAVLSANVMWEAHLKTKLAVRKLAAALARQMPWVEIVMLADQVSETLHSSSSNMNRFLSENWFG